MAETGDSSRPAPASQPGGRDDGAAPAKVSGEAVLAMRNAFILSASLIGTWSVALVVRLIVPRYLGPETFGQFNFADTLAANFFLFAGLGVDTYMQKELPARPEHASDFMGGILSLRAVLTLGLLVAMEVTLRATGRSAMLQVTALVFGVAQILSQSANTFATLLYAARTVGRLAALNVVTKFLWAGGVAAALAFHAPLPAFAGALVLSEAVRCGVLGYIVHRHMSVRYAVDARHLRHVLLASTPYYVSAVAGALYSKIDVSIMGMIMPDREVGYYSSAANISTVAMLVAPLMGWVLMPQLARAAARSKDELLQMLRRSLEWTVAMAIPIATFLGLGADVIVHRVFGDAFEPATLSLRVLSPIFLVVYVAMLGSTTLVLLGKSWTATLVSIASLVANAALNLIFVRPAFALLGTGGAGAAAAAISVVTEAAVATTLLVLVGRAAFDRRNLRATFLSVVVCAVTIVVDRACAPHLGALRLAVDAVVYLVGVTVTRAVQFHELFDLVRAALSRRRAAKE